LSITTFVSVDPSKSHTGITVWHVHPDTGHITLAYQGVINNPDALEGPNDVMPYRRIVSGIKATIETYKPDFLFVEQMFQGMSPAVTEMLFVAAFCVRWAASEMNVPFRIVPVMGKKGWRYFHIGPTYAKLKGGLGKVAARQKIEANLGIKLKNEHIGDSAAIGLAGYFYETGKDYRDVMGIEKPDFSDVPKEKPARKPRKSKKD
jgi:hypothetical protein